MLTLKRLPYIPQVRQHASDPATWLLVPDRLSVPTGGVALAGDSIFLRAMENNIAYLLESFSVDHMLYPFRVRAGWTNPPCGESQIKFWDNQLRGSNAGRFLMGAGNTLRWIPHRELRQRMDAVVDGIAACQDPEGYIYPWPPEQMLRGAPGTPWSAAQESNYARAWLTHGLIDAWLAGNERALPLARAGHDWFNHCQDLQALNTVAVWMQGQVASTRLYFTPVGKAEDLQVAEAWYVVDDWMDQLSARNPDGIWKTGLAWPHCYEITAFEAYLDHYRATGDQRYLNAMLGAWELINGQWEHFGGSIALCEELDYPPSSYFIEACKSTGEFCGSVFWVKFNQRLHNLFPEDERYTAEIEKSLYNVALADQQGIQGIRYHTHLEGQKEPGTRHNTCCEGQGTRLLASLPEYIYSLAEDGVYVNLFEPATLTASIGGHEFTLAMQTSFPFAPAVAIRVVTVEENRMRLHLRVPCWASGEILIAIHGTVTAVGQPGTYIVLDRVWRNGDTVSFDLPTDVRITRYRGADQFPWHQRFVLEYGPILLAVVGSLGKDLPIVVNQYPEELKTWLLPVPGQPLHFRIAGLPEHIVMPYWLVPDGQPFTCFPVLAGR